MLATKGGDTNLGGHETGHGFGSGSHLEDGMPKGIIIAGIISTRGPSATYMASQDFDNIL